MGTVVKYDNIFQYNESRGVETLHPLVSVIDFSKAEPIPPGHYRHCFGFYAVFLKDVKCGDLRYGRNYYDYQEGTLVFMAPGQVVEVEVKDKPQVPPKGRALLFHPDLLRGTSLGRNIAGYTFFSYEVNEALHLSEQERQVVMDCLQNIQSELKHAIDKHSRTLIVSNIELLLNYSTRFYERQFITRNNVNRDVLAGFERLLGDYFAGDRPERDGVPSVRRAAAPVGELFRRPGEEGDREIGPGVHPAQGDRHRQGTHLRPRTLDQRNRLLAGIPLPAALHASVQEGGGVFAQRIPDRKLTQKTLPRRGRVFHTQTLTIQTMQWPKIPVSLFSGQRSRKIPGPAIAISRYFGPGQCSSPCRSGN